MQKRGISSLPVPQIEAFALPYAVERDNVEAHADMDTLSLIQIRNIQRALKTKDTCIAYQ